MRFIKTILFVSLMVLLTACGRQLSESDTNTSASVSADTTVEEVAPDDEEEAVSEELEAAPEEEAEAVVEQQEEPPADPFAVRVSEADPANGEAIFAVINSTGFACSSCHNVANVERLVGPGLYGIPATGSTRVADQSIHEYLYVSITNPNDYVVEEYPENLMPQNYTEVYTEDEIYDLVAYLMTLDDGTMVEAEVEQEPTEEVVAEATEETEAAIEATEEVVAEAEVEQEATEAPAEATEVVEDTVTLVDPDFVPADITYEDLDRLVGIGIPVLGESLYTLNCAECHGAETTENGPSMATIIARADASVEPANFYLYSQTINPAVHGELAEEFSNGSGFNEIYDVLAYLMTVEVDAEALAAVEAPTEVAVQPTVAPTEMVEVTEEPEATEMVEATEEVVEATEEPEVTPEPTEVVEVTEEPEATEMVEATEEVVEATEEPEVTPEPTEMVEVTEEPEATEEPTVDTDLIALVEAADAERGQELYNEINSSNLACATCHYDDSEDRLIGPGLLNIGTTAENRVEGQDAHTYIYNAIVDQNDYVVPDYPAGLRPDNYSDAFTEQDIYDIMAYLFTLMDNE